MCKSLNRKSEFLELIHIKLADLKQIITRGGKNILSDFYRWFFDVYKVYLLKHKHEALYMFLI